MCIHVVHLVHMLISEKTLKDIVGHYVIVRLNICCCFMNELIYLTFVYSGDSTEN